MLPGQAEGWTPERRQQIEALLKSAIAREEIPGLSVSVVLHDELVWSAGFGFADLEHRVPCTSSTLHRIASVSKPVTATAAMQLFERGLLDLDAPIQKYVPAFPVKRWPITSRQLLQHTAGIRHYRPDEELNTHRYESVASSLAPFRDDDLLHEPGSAFRYTSYGYVLLGAAIEGASGMSYRNYVRANILEPCGMTATRPDEPEPVIAGRARGYLRRKSGEVVNCAWVDQSNKLPAGGWLSSAEDLAKFAVSVQKGRLLKSETRDEMWTRVRTSSGREMDYSRGWMSLWQDNVLQAVGHGGNQTGATALLHIEPRRRRASVLLMNLETYRGIFQLNGKLLALLP
jgi:CubicO group peptidase (beta-lactamase class C family)